MDGEPAGLFLGTWTPGVWLRAMPAMVGTAALDKCSPWSASAQTTFPAYWRRAPPELKV